MVVRVRLSATRRWRKERARATGAAAGTRLWEGTLARIIWRQSHFSHVKYGGFRKIPWRRNGDGIGPRMRLFAASARSLPAPTGLYLSSSVGVQGLVLDILSQDMQEDTTTPPFLECNHGENGRNTRRHLHSLARQHSFSHPPPSRRESPVLEDGTNSNLWRQPTSILSSKAKRNMHGQDCCKRGVLVMAKAGCHTWNALYAIPSLLSPHNAGGTGRKGD